MNKTLYFSIASHGFGHIGMTAPIINDCFKRFPGITIVIQCATTKESLRQWIQGDFVHVDVPADIGVINNTAFVVESVETHRRYLKRHLNWSTHVKQQMAILSTFSPDLVISNVSEVTIEAAYQANINCLALCSLNWAEIYWTYCQQYDRANDIFDTLTSAYQKANYFLIPTPGMTMPFLDNKVPIGTIARIGNDSTSLRQHLNLPQNKKVVLVSMGGIPTPIDTTLWPRDDNVIWLGAFEPNDREDLVYFPKLDLSYIDILSNCDALITKPGYGNFAESCCNAVPVLYIRRPDWPEEPCLVDWLKKTANCGEINLQDMKTGHFIEDLDTLLKQRPIAPLKPSGVEDTIEFIEELW